MYQMQQPVSSYEGWQFHNEDILSGRYNPEQNALMEQQANQIAQMQTAFDKMQEEKALAEQQQALEQQRAEQRNRTNLAFQMVNMMGSDDGSSEFDILRPLLGNISAYGGHLYDGETEPTQQTIKNRFPDYFKSNGRSM